MNAPSITSMTGKAYHWALSILEEELYHLIQLCAKMGYHPKEWRTSIAVALKKPKRDYSLLRLYRLIQLLEVLGKVLERVQAHRLSYIAAKHNLFPSSQFGGIPGRSAEDALLCTVHDIETAWNHKCKASILTFDITGFFNTIPHSHLIDTLCAYHLPLLITQWVHSFLQDRKAAICLDGKRDELRTIETGIPQGSCVLPILAAYFTSLMIRTVHHVTSTCIEESTELSPLFREDKITLSPTMLYVDNGAIMASGPSLDTTAQMSSMAFEETHKWLAKRGLKTDQVKNELIHFTKTKNWNPSPSILILSHVPGTLKEVSPAKCTRYLGLW